ncbi:prefoldin subunit 4-like [Mizuhopecten yessoensis]|uniref:prefoldin subunit 4-like n=1 Tax=Mizuhopecten yessoensis TaxID=6573 RepID=UPI000B45AF22|nr:prefoldin subunit 4-like [Mizuhopecten yessoensis]
MAATMKNSDTDTQVTYQDQQKINKFARNNARLQDLRDEEENKKKELQNLEDAADEILMLEDGDDSIPYQIGEVFVSLNAESTGEMLEKAKLRVQEEMKEIDSQCEVHKQILQDLKVELYAKFGNNINLEADDDS